jgi:hypothetical protein
MIRWDGSLGPVAQLNEGRLGVVPRKVVPVR